MTTKRKVSTLSARLTFHYAAGYDSLDEWTEEIGKFSVLNAQHHPGHNDIDSTLTLRVDKSAFTRAHNQPDTIVAQALYNTLTKGCRCEHDCCGHWQTMVTRVHKTKRKEWSVDVHAYRNV